MYSELHKIVSRTIKDLSLERKLMTILDRHDSKISLELFEEFVAAFEENKDDLYSLVIKMENEAVDNEDLESEVKDLEEHVSDLKDEIRRLNLENIKLKEIIADVHKELKLIQEAL